LIKYITIINNIISNKKIKRSFVKKIFLAFIFLLGSAQSSFSMSQKILAAFKNKAKTFTRSWESKNTKEKAQSVWNGTKRTGRVAGALFYGVGGYSLTKAYDSAFNINNNLCNLNGAQEQKCNDFFRNIARRTSPILSDHTFIPAIHFDFNDELFFGTCPNLSKTKEHLIILNETTMNSILTGNQKNTAIFLHEMQHIKHGDFKNNKYMRSGYLFAAAALCLKQMPLLFKIPAIIATAILPNVAHHAYFENRADEAGPLTLATTQELKEFKDFFSKVSEIGKTATSSQKITGNILSYHPETAYRLERIQQRIINLEQQEAIGYQILNLQNNITNSVAERDNLDQVTKLRHKQKQLQLDWENSSTTFEQIWLGFKAHFKV
jgi:Zn-dependent protease with chaperone function